MSEILAQIVSEIRRDYPDVPLAPGVDLERLKKSDSEPFFVTLPLVKVGGRSGNGFTWQEPDVRRVVEEINQKKPEGGVGHIKPEDRATHYEMPKLRWVGAIIVDGQSYGKAYIPKYASEVREFFTNADAVGARVGTSVYGVRGEKGLADMTLEKIDLGHPDRVGSKDSAAIPKITSEIQDKQDEQDKRTEDDDVEANDKLVAELERQRDTANATVAELQGKLGSHDTIVAELDQQKADYAALVSELNLGDKPLVKAKALVNELAGLRQYKLVSEIDGLLGDEKVVKNQLVRPLLRKFLVKKDGTPLVESVDDARAIIQEQLEDPDMIELSKQLVSEQRGGGAYVGGGNNGDSKNKLEDTPDNRQKARSKFGV